MSENVSENNPFKVSFNTQTYDRNDKKKEYWVKVKTEEMDLFGLYEKLGRGEHLILEDHDKKSAPFFVGCGINEGHRKKENCYSRELLTLDADHGIPKLDEEYDFILYSTFSHTRKNPKCRIVFRLSRQVNEVEYNKIANKMMSQYGVELFDVAASSDYSRAMFFPSCPQSTKKEDRIFKFNEGFITSLEVDEILAQCDEYDHIKNYSGTLPDPRGKDGPVGEFCRAFNDIHTVIEKFLPEVYERTRDSNRYSYIPADSKNGTIVYDENQYIYSNHASDPACTGHSENGYDLVRIHKFSGEETEMNAWMGGLKEVNELRAKEMFEDQEEEKLCIESSNQDNEFLMKAPGILGDMIRNNMAANPFEPVPEYAAISSLVTLSMSLSNRYRSKFKEGKLNLSGIIIGKTGSGKNDPLRFFSSSCKTCFNKKAYDKIKSGPALAKSLVFDNGRAAFAIDEIHRLLAMSESKELWAREVADILMVIFTARQYEFEPDLARTLAKEFRKEIKDLDKELNKDGQCVSSDREKQIEREKAMYSNLLNVLDNGLTDPAISILGATTPDSVKSYLTPKSMGSGSFNRFLWAIPHYLNDRPFKVKLVTEEMEERDIPNGYSFKICNKLKEFYNKDKNITITQGKEARDFLFKEAAPEIEKFVHNQPVYENLFERTGEMIIKIASIVCAGDDKTVIEKEHMEWSYKYYMYSMKSLVYQYRMAKLPDGTPSADVKDAKIMYMKRVMETLRETDEPLTKRKLGWKFRKEPYNCTKTLQEAMDKLLLDGKIMKSKSGKSDTYEISDEF